MGFMDKLKNIFFEEEEDEEIEEPVSPKKEKYTKVEKDKEEEIQDGKKTKLKESIAKKVELPKKEKIDKNDFEGIEISINEGIEISQEEKVKEEKKIEKTHATEKIKKENKINQELIFDDDDFILDTKPKVKKEEKVVVPKKEEVNLYRGRENKKVDTIKVVKNDYSKTTYGNKKEEVKSKTFTPSPIISPIYGILDKNYKKEEVKDNKEIRISSRPSRMDLDSVRNKAFGDLEYDLNLMDDYKKEEVKEVDKKNSEKKKDDIKKIYKKASEEEEKPIIEKVTLGEADEYYNDLGLAYNTDYKDLSKDLNDGKVSKKEKSETDNLEDNLFDLIESMYDKDKE